MYQIVYTVNGVTYNLQTPYSRRTMNVLKKKYSEKLTAIKSIKLY